MEKDIVANHIAQVQKAIDVMATNPGMNLKQVGDEVGVTGRTIANWIAQPKVVEKIYDRYMELAGKHLPEVVQAIIEEAKLGNVHAARLVLEHFGKLQNTLRIQVESNFERFMKADDAEEVDLYGKQKWIKTGILNEETNEEHVFYTTGELLALAQDFEALLQKEGTDMDLYVYGRGMVPTIFDTSNYTNLPDFEENLYG